MPPHVGLVGEHLDQVRDRRPALLQRLVDPLYDGGGLLGLHRFDQHFALLSWSLPEIRKAETNLPRQPPPSPSTTKS
jgi:hypothetical protein